MAYRDVKPKVEDGSSEQGDASTAPSPLSVASAGGAGSQSTYTDYVLRASPATDGRDGWRYNVMKLASVGDKQVDFAGQDWAKPVKLNRKDPRFVRRQIEEDRLRRRNAALGKDESGDTIMGDENGGDSDASDVKGKGKEKEVMDPSLVGRGLTGESAAARNKRKPFKKKTKRVYVTSEEQRRVRRQEFAPWMLEDAKGDERWVGRLEGGAGDASQRKMNESAASSRTGTKGWRPEAKASESGGGGSSYVFFVFGENGEDFQIVPANRWYKFTSEPKYEIFDNEEAEAQVRSHAWLCRAVRSNGRHSTRGSRGTMQTPSDGSWPAATLLLLPPLRSARARTSVSCRSHERSASRARTLLLMLACAVSSRMTTTTTQRTTSRVHSVGEHVHRRSRATTSSSLRRSLQTTRRASPRLTTWPMRRRRRSSRNASSARCELSSAQTKARRTKQPAQTLPHSRPPAARCASS